MPPDDEPKVDPWAALDKQPDEEPVRHPLLENVFHYLMLGLCAVVVFAVAGGLAVLLVSRRYALSVTMDDVWMQFLIGGTFGLVGAIGIYCGTRPRDTI